MLNNVINTIKKYNLIENGDKIVIGVSGGPDSMCLLDILYKVMSKKMLGLEFEIFVCHINHGTRNGESDNDAKFVENYSSKLNIPFHLFSYNLEKEAQRLDMSSEEAGRYLRYNAFKEVLRKVGANKIATAHNLDDNVETVFLNLVRGTGLTGLTGIKIKNDNIIRPLLMMEKANIINYLKENSVEYKIDYTNAETVYTRNKIRNGIIPKIKNEINPNVLSSISNTINLLIEDDKALTNIANAEFERLRTDESKDMIAIAYNEFNKCELSIKRRVIREAIKRVNNNSLKDISLCYIDKIIELVPGKEIDLPFFLKATCRYEDIRIYKQEENGSKECYKVYDEVINDEGIFSYDFSTNYIDQNISYEIRYEVININDFNFDEVKNNKNKFIAYFDLDKVKGKVVIRNKIDGDKITIDEEGHTKKVKELFIDEKINKQERMFIFIVEDRLNDSNGTLMDVLGYRWNPMYKIDSNTKRVIKIEQIKK